LCRSTGDTRNGLLRSFSATSATKVNVAEFDAAVGGLERQRKGGENRREYE
jgi:hypothetical protein